MIDTSQEQRWTGCPGGSVVYLLAELSNAGLDWYDHLARTTISQVLSIRSLLQLSDCSPEWLGAA